ncbi:MAG: UDP-N-acetylmuramoyl-L-alanyl-D-glutamate--2,6-diaminopimelate ligase, partial [Planctomycetota bacterium]|jgi:UDP-N-acetylmuramoyl-L-alanyl-D-glutamate--2,6-diaminopimelate ligase
VPVVLVEDARRAKADAAAMFYRNPSHRIDCIGITGTNGKTTVSYMLKSILEQDGRPTGLIGTIRHHIGDRTVPSLNTTPDPIDLQRYLAEMVDDNSSAAVLEVSSHALDQDRAGNVVFRTGVFTNLSREHLDYHKNMEAYGRAKELLFSGLPNHATAVINADDPMADRMAGACCCPVVRFGFSIDAEITAELRRLDVDGFSMILKTPSGGVDITSRLPGRFNVMNAMAAAAAAISLDVPLAAVKAGIETLKRIEGRMESLDCGQDFRVIVDYAHTHDALHNILQNLKPLTVGRLITVFGCGGDRDRTKRPLMAEAATTLSDHTVITSDNPRTEDPNAIIEDILEGVTPDASHEVEPDRRKAIEKGIAMAFGGDIVVIAGKGHENYQILKNGIVDFDDRQIAREVLWKLYR